MKAPSLLRFAVLLMMSAFYMPSPAQRTVCDMEAALQYCREAQLAGPEGIWEFPEDETRVLIRKSPLGQKGYDIIVISTPDCRLHAGDIIGHMNPSSERTKYTLSLNTSKTGALFSGTRKCVAEFSDKDDSIRVHPMKIKISMRTMWFLPKFWRSLRVSFDNPAAELPQGLLRIYPLTQPRTPIYL